jgi:hypothetical protein
MNVEDRSMRAPLSARKKLLLLAGVALVLALAVPLAFVFVDRHRKREETKRILAEHLPDVRFGISGQRETFDSARWFLSSYLIFPNDTAGQSVRTTWFAPPAKVAQLGEESDVVRDAWGNPLLVRYPGSVHRRGFDFYSTGPNGLDEEGSGDDILVGADVGLVREDVAAVASR